MLSLERDPKTNETKLVQKIISTEDLRRVLDLEAQLKEIKELHTKILIDKNGDWEKDANNLERHVREVLVVNNSDHPEGVA